nr:LacI family DNA-binding transcriptional regulator [Luteimicrobium album]
MIDVARLAGVSQQTVSRVVNAHPSVSADVRARVERAVAQLNYRPNPAARALVTSRSMNIGVLSYGLAQYGPSVVLTGLVEEARVHGYATMLAGLGDLDPASARAALGHLVDDAVDGIVLLAPVEPAIEVVHHLEVAVPLVEFAPGRGSERSAFGLDEVLGARLVTAALLDLGHETVIHVTGAPGWLGTEARLGGWREALSDRGRVMLAPHVADWSAASGYQVGQVIARERAATAVFAANDQTAIGVIRALKEHGVAVPGDVSVVGFDDIPEAAYVDPPLTTVHLDFASLGALAVHALLGAMGDDEAGAARSTPVPRVVTRASSAPPG